MFNVLKYYGRSNCVSCLAALWLVTGCGASANQIARGAPRVSFAELSGPQRKQALETLVKGPTVIHFKRGERVPVELALDSKLIQLEAPQLTLIAKRDFDLLLRGDGPVRLSADGVDFEAQHANYFGFGFDVERDAETSLRVKIGVQPEARAQDEHGSAP